MRFFAIFLYASAALLPAMQEPPLPVWDEVERQKMIGEGWIAGGILLTFEPFTPPQQATEKEAPLGLEAPTAEVIAEAEEEDNVVDEKYLVEYFAEKPEGHLVDPQSLLSTKEVKDLEAFLKYHSGDSSIDMFVYVFDGEQVIPSDVRKEEVVERLYSVGKPAMVAYYYLGAPQRSEIYLSPVITDSVSAAEQRRALESSVMQAFSSVDSASQLEAFLVQMSIRIYWMERMSEGTALETAEAIPDGSDARAFHRKKEDSETVPAVALPKWSGIAGALFASFCGGLLVIWSAMMWWKNRVRYRFPEFEVEPRLGGNHAAGIGAVISFSSSAVPPARQRDQVPDYMRRA